MARFRLLGPAGLGILVALGIAHACYYEALNLENPADFYYRLCYAGCTHMDNKNNDYGQCCTPLPAGATAPALCTTLSQKVLAAGTTCQWGAVPTTDFPSTYSYATQPAPGPPAPSPSTQYGNNDKVTVWVTSTTTTPCAVTQPLSQPPPPPPSPSASYVPPQPAPSPSPSYSHSVCTCPEDPTYNHDKRNPRPPCSCDSTGMSAGSTQSESTVTTWTTVTTTSSTTVSMPQPLVSSISCSASSCPHVGDPRPTDYKRMFVSEIRANPTANHDKRDFSDDISARRVDDHKLNARQQDVLPTVTTTMVEAKVTTITTGGCSQAGNAYAYYTGVPTSSTIGPALITSTYAFGRREVQTYTKVVTSTSWSTVIKSTTCASSSGAPPSQPTCYCTQPPASPSGGPLFSHSACSGTGCPSVGDARPSNYRRGPHNDFARRGNGAAPTVCPCGGPKVVSSSGPTASAGLPPDPMNCACPSGAPGPNPSPSGGPLYSAPGCTTSGCATIGDARPSNYRRAFDDLYARNQPAMNCACYPSTGMSAMPTQSNTGYVPQIISTCPCPGGPSGSPSHQPPAVPSPSPSGPMYSAPSCTTSGCATIGDARPSGWKRNGFWNRDVNHNTCACPAAQPSPSGQNQPSNSQPAPSGPSNKPSGPISYLIPSCSTSGCATIGDARPSDYKRAIPPAYITPSPEVKHKRGLAEARAHHAPLKGHKVEERATRPTDYVTEREFVEARHYNVTLRAVDEDLHVGSLMTRGVEKRNGQPETLTSTSWITTDDCKPTSSVYVHPSPSVPAPSPSVPAPSPSVPAPPPSYTNSPSASPSPSSSKGSTGYAAQPTSSASQNSEDCDTSSGSTGYAAQSTQSSKLYSVAPSSSGQPHIGDARPSGYDTDLLMQERRGNGL